jgi:hypothetical protein
MFPLYDQLVTALSNDEKKEPMTEKELAKLLKCIKSIKDENVTELIFVIIRTHQLKYETNVQPPNVPYDIVREDKKTDSVLKCNLSKFPPELQHLLRLFIDKVEKNKTN